MGRINIEIPDDLHQQLRTESAVKNVPIKMIVIRALRDHSDSVDLDVDPAMLD
ncbi:hypothetical protein [Haloferax prahovense]|uniref:hypothetical protein n=1 Tax=Haloferax prahovense TaxID=381852 RepID=UPI000AA09A28|nr:hypothetical protein [Haloferax prahovense]